MEKSKEHWGIEFLGYVAWELGIELGIEFVGSIFELLLSGLF